MSISQSPLKLAVAGLLLVWSHAALSQSISAENDRTAQYQNGEFSLPESIADKQKYVIVIQVPSRKDRLIELPEGANSLRLVPSARPSGDWRWSYFVRPLAKVAIDVLNYPDVKTSVPLTGLRGTQDTRYIYVEWKHNPQVKGYQIVTQPITVLATGEKPGKETTLASDALEDQIADTGQSERFGELIKVTPGQRLNWRVEGLNEWKDVIAASDMRRIEIEESWYAGLSKSGFKLQRAETLLAKEINPTNALFSFSNVSSAAKGTTAAVHDAKSYSTEFAVIWQGKPLWAAPQPYFAPAASFEARLNSNGTAKANDVMRARYGFGLLLEGKHATDIVGNLKWERDRKTKLEKGFLEFRATPVFEPFQMFWPRYGKEDTDPYSNVLPGKEKPLLIALMPSIGIDAGKTMLSRLPDQPRGTEIRLVGALRLDLEIPLLASVLQVPRVSGTTTATTRYLTKLDDDRRRDYVTSSLDIWLGPNLTLVGSYKVGRDAPAFDWGRSFTLGVSAKF